MKARLFQIVLALVLAFGASTGAAKADQDFTTPIVARLEDEGFAVTRIKRTWLGRILIVSQNDEYLREVVINPHTGEILRDKLFALDGTSAVASPMLDMPDGMPDSMMEDRGSNSGGSMGGGSGGSMGGGSGGSMGGGSGGGMSGGN